MFRALVGTIGLVAMTVTHVIYAKNTYKDEMQKIADTNTVSNEWQYVLVRYARGDYYNRKGFDTMKTDFKFYKTISHFHD